MKNSQTDIPGRLLLPVAIAVMALFAACGGSDGDGASIPTTVAPVSTPTASVAPTATTAPVATPAPSPTVAPTATTAAAATEPAGSVDDEQLAQGRVIFEETAGGVGCAFCHGRDGEGDGPSGLGAPPNRGATRDRFQWALDGGETDAMTFIKLSSAEKDAVLAYLQFLGTQP